MLTSRSQREKYDASLQSALQTFQSLLTSSSSKSWKLVPTSSQSAGASTSKAKQTSSSSSIGSLTADPVVHRRLLKASSCEVLRATGDFTVGDNVRIQDFVAVLQRPETRSTWDRLAEQGSILEILDSATYISKTNYKLGWPASPRDSITVSRLLTDGRQTAIHVSTSLPRSNDEPSFLRPAPPYVRSHMHLHAWCIQLPDPSTSSRTARITVFLQWNLKGALLSHSALDLSNLLTNFLVYASTRAESLPLLLGYGKAVDVANNIYKSTEDVLLLDYLITHPDDELDQEQERRVKESIDELQVWKEWKRLERSVEVSLDVNIQGWDVQIALTGGLGTEKVETGYTISAERSGTTARAVLKVQHARLANIEHSVKVQLTLRRLVGGKHLRVNGTLINIEQVQERDLSSLQHRTLLDEPLGQTLSPHLQGSVMSVDSNAASGSSSADQPSLLKQKSTGAAIATLVKRSYTYFASLLQEPEAKWRHVTEQKGVSIAQLNSIDPTVTIFRGQAIYVGIGVWDLFSTVINPGARAVWDKNLEDMVLLDDLNELSSLWHTTSKAVWPAWARDSVTIRTAYKSSTSVHIFSFSTEDKELFPQVPAQAPNSIRTQTVIQGWAIEALSPTTTQITLIEQTDSKGWSNKSWTYSNMINAVFGVGDFTIKSGSPPVLTRLLGAKVHLNKYDSEKGSLKLEYCAVPATSAAATATLECEIRCDIDVWSSSLDIVTDPPPLRISCLSRHRLASGGGCWVTIEHDAALVADDPVFILIRRGPTSRAKGSVFVNGSKQKTDSEELGSDEVKVLSAKKRMKSSPMPLDQWPSANISSRTSTKSDEAVMEKLAEAINNPRDKVPIVVTGNNPRQAKHSAVLISSAPDPPIAKVNQPSMCYALEGLSCLQTFHAEQGPEVASSTTGWITVLEKPNAYARKKIVPLISPTVPVHRADMIVEGLTAERLLGVIGHQELRAQWDDRLESYSMLEAYGSGCSTGYMITKAPYITSRKRLFYLASASAQFRVPSASASSSTSTVYLFASASCPKLKHFSASKINNPLYPEGTLYFEGWILETIDPYTSEMFAIPSTRLSYFTCIDWANALPFNLGGGGSTPNVLKCVDAVAKLAKQLNSPTLYHPTSILQIEGPLSSDDSDECVWCLDGVKSEQSTFIKSSSACSSEFYKIMLLAPRLVIDTALPTSAARQSPSSPPAFRRLPTLLRTSTTMPAMPKLSTTTIDGKDSPPPTLRHESSLSSLKNPNRTMSSPPRSRSHTPSASLNIPNSPTSDFLLGEIIIAPEDYRHGISVSVTVEAKVDSGSSQKTTPSFDTQPLLNLDYPVRLVATKLRDTTFQSMTASSHQKIRQLLRFTLPTGQFVTPVSDPLREGYKPTVPAWYQQLLLHPHLISINIVPISASEQTDSVTAPPGRIVYNGVEIQAQQGKASLDLGEEDDWSLRLPRLSRMPRRIRRSDGNNGSIPLLPEILQSPIAIAGRFLPDSPVAAEVSSSSEVTADPSSSLSHGTPEQSRRSTLIRAVSDSKQNETGETGSLSNVLASYPLSLAASAFHGKTGNFLLGPYSATVLILVALVAFLLGSFLRSLLTPSDFILYPRPEGEVDLQIIRALDPERKWKQARRVLEFRLPLLLDHNLMLAIIRRR